MGEALSYTLPAFPGGLNKIDPIDAFPETDADELTNLYPAGNKLELRKGIESFALADASNDPCYTLDTLPLQDGTEQLIAGCGANFLLITEGNAASLTGSTTPTNNEWQTHVFSNRIFCVNGTNTSQVYTGSSTMADTSFTGVTQSLLINVGSYKERLYFVEKNSASVWYGGVRSISGALTEFPVDYWLKQGGYVVACGSWSNSVHEIARDLFWILSSEGEILFYSGSYPGDSTWHIVARFFIGKPLGFRAFGHVENDLWFLTTKGVVPVSMLFQGSTSVAANSLSRKVNAVIQAAAKSYPFSFMYNVKFWPGGNRVYITYPTTAANTRQIVINVETGAWCTNQYAVSGAALCMVIHNDKPYLGSALGYVYDGSTGYNDDTMPISFLAKGGFNFFGKRGLYKKFLDIRPILRTNAQMLALELDMDTDFRRSNTYGTIRSEADTAASSTWDEATWDTAEWADEERYVYERYPLGQSGHSGALRIKGSILDAFLEFYAFEIGFKEGSRV